MKALVRCRGVDVVLGERLVLQGVDLAVSAGRVHLLVGPNGGGKTTLLRLLLGLLRPTRGSVTWSDAAGEESLQPFPIGYVAQRSSADFRYPLTVRDVVGLIRQGRPGPRDARADAAAVDAALGRMRLRELADRPIAQLSGGQQQRTLIARALALGAPLLLLDEPTTGLDAVSQEDLLALLRELRDRDGVAIVMSTHHPGDALALADHGFRVARTLSAVPVHELEEPHRGPPQGAGGG